MEKSEAQVSGRGRGPDERSQELHWSGGHDQGQRGGLLRCFSGRAWLAPGAWSDVGKLKARVTGDPGPYVLLKGREGFQQENEFRTKNRFGVSCNVIMEGHSSIKVCVHERERKNERKRLEL